MAGTREHGWALLNLTPDVLGIWQLRSGVVFLTVLSCTTLEIPSADLHMDVQGCISRQLNANEFSGGEHDGTLQQKCSLQKRVRSNACAVAWGRLYAQVRT